MGLKEENKFHTIKLRNQIWFVKILQLPKKEYSNETKLQTVIIHIRTRSIPARTDFK